MFSQFRPNVAASLGMIVLLSAGSAWAQIQPGKQPQNQQPQIQQQQQQQQVQQQQRQQRFSAVPQGAQQSAHTDAQLAAWLIVDNQNEVALAKLGQERAKNDDIKQLAEKMRDDHQQMVSKLQQFAGTVGNQQPRAGNNAQNEERRDAQDVNANARAAQANNNPQAQQPANAEGAVAGANQAQMAHGINFVALKRELGAQCLQSAQRELGEKSGREFDECFLGMQLGIHHEAVVTMTVFRNHASPALQQVLDNGIQTAQAHLKHAKELMKDERNSKTETSQR
jgi:predicted outer membrane protein